MMLETIINQATIETPRFDLRPVRVSDAGLIEMYISDKRVSRNTSSIPHPLPPGLVEAFIGRVSAADRTEDAWVMDGTKMGGGEVMGVISLTRVDVGQSEIGYWVAPAFWNSGIASEAVAALVAANPQQCRTIFATVHQGNAASARVLTNCGFCYLGDAETYSVAQGAKVPTWTYSRKQH
ncbi:GNAT family N-acetyltransferase [Pseudohalocynthiibacter aestuariivivens]|uniref:GNAT family N-acetyltransferase n=1 Tax=Roseovarius pelagicus TaxID=2980108 RepID=A0ABY6DDF3_9RHOB|nr:MULTISPECIES: GNAT family N-acetyltransferase [Rhodobacterales]QIE44225.1 GNAT family N-acetyltransferase [Pseudohalocynthiibacter aestuariivivens]UXX83874.1 GNAT family N-acetyltransferase [Roseovarius pelagicus]